MHVSPHALPFLQMRQHSRAPAPIERIWEKLANDCDRSTFGRSTFDCADDASSSAAAIEIRIFMPDPSPPTVSRDVDQHPNSCPRAGGDPVPYIGEPATAGRVWSATLFTLSVLTHRNVALQISWVRGFGNIG